jgi:pimeloyl-ACP methyl ester carboxylesterase
MHLTGNHKAASAEQVGLDPARPEQDASSLAAQGVHAAPERGDPEWGKRASCSDGIVPLWSGIRRGEHRVQTGSHGRQVEFRSLDGLQLRGTLEQPSSVRGPAVVLVHGGGVTREEGGFYTRLAAALAEAGLPSLRFDFRAHGASEGRGEDLTIAAVANDIGAAVTHVREMTDTGPVDLIGASFGGGISALFTARHPGQVRRLVLFNPLLDYKERFIDDKPDWDGDQISEQAGLKLTEQGFLAHSPTFRLGRPLLNEVFYLSPRQALSELTVPVLLVHGTGDTFVPVESSRAVAGQIGGARLIEIDGAQHGFAVHDDPQYREPQTQQWQAFVIRSVTQWLTETG